MIILIVVLQSFNGLILIDKDKFLAYLQDNDPTVDAYKKYLLITYSIRLIYSYLIDFSIIFGYIGIFLSYKKRLENIKE